MPEFRRTVSPVLGGAIVLAAACSHAPSSTFSTNRSGDPAAARLARGFSSEVRDGVARVRAVTAPFHNLDSAVAAGYPREVNRCYADPHHGAMGFHHLNRAYLDSALVAERPEILLYERLDDGRYRLNGVEFIVPYRIWSRDSAVPPRVFGLDLQRADDLNLWYLHAWVWQENPAGLFADWNPTVRCPPG